MSQWYKTGTVDVTLGSAVVTGTGTVFTVAGIKQGDVFTIDGSKVYEILSVDTETQLTLTVIYGETTATDSSYAIVSPIPGTTNADLASRITNMVASWQLRENEFRDWHGGSATGGPYANGTYPLTDFLGNVLYLSSPAKLVQDGVGSDVLAKAEQWAEEAEDVEVETGKYSAKHHAAKSAYWAGQAASALDDVLTALNVTANAGAVADVFVYDTSRDSDGGAWRYRCQKTSWQIEPLNTADRGATSEFPAVALIVAEADALTIYDATDETVPMWMTFDRATVASRHVLVQSKNLTSVSMKDGLLAVGASTGANAGCLYLIDFVRDLALRYDSQLNVFQSGLADRNEIVTYAIDASSDGLTYNDVFDVAVESFDGNLNPLRGLPGLTVAAVARNGTNGVVEFIHPDGSITALTGYTLTRPDAVDLGVDYWLGPAAYTQNNSERPQICAIPSLDTDQSSVAKRAYSTPIFSAWHYNVTKGGEREMIFHDSNVTGRLHRMVESHLCPPINTNSSEHLYNVTTIDFNTGWMIQNHKLCALANANNLDRAASAMSLTVNGVISESAVATGTELKGYALNSLSGYISGADAKLIVSAAALSGWVKFTGTSGTIISIGEAAAGKARTLHLNGGAISLSTYSEAFAHSRVINDGKWHFVVAAIDTNGLARISVDGGDFELQQMTAPVTPATGNLRIGVSLNATIGFIGSAALLRVGSRVPSQSEVRFMYDQEREMFMPDADCLLAATGAIKKLAFDDITKTLHVGTDSRRMAFNGLIRTDHEATDSGDGISAVNGYIGGGS